METQRLKLAVIAATVATMVLAGASGGALAVGDEGTKSSNPMSGDKDSEKAGKTVYRSKCAYCHGLNANGRGRGLPNAADLRKYKKGYTHFVKTIKEGYKTMPPWGALGKISDDEIDQVGAYLETLAKRNANWADPVEGSESAVSHLLILASTTSEPAEPAEPKAYEVHIGHILTGLPGTPGDVGLATILEEELAIAQAHAGYAAADLKDWANIQLHTHHVRHAVDPAAETSGQGPGLGYGIVKATDGIVQHMEFSRDSADASESAKIHSVHVITAARNIAAWARLIVDRCGQIIGGASPVWSAFYAEENLEQLGWILNGHDANGDGTISWEEGEGGLAQIKAHLSYIE